MSMESPAQNNQQEDSKSADLIKQETPIIIPEILDKKENLPFEEVKWEWKTRLFTHVADSLDDWVSTTARDNNVRLSMARNLIDPAESEISIELRGKRKDVEETISGIKNHLKLFNTWD